MFSDSVLVIAAHPLGLAAQLSHLQLESHAHPSLPAQVHEFSPFLAAHPSHAQAVEVVRQTRVVVNNDKRTCLISNLPKKRSCGIVAGETGNDKLLSRVSFSQKPSNVLKIPNA